MNRIINDLSKSIRAATRQKISMTVALIIKKKSLNA